MSVIHKIERVTVIGAGAIGTSWTALFLANKLEVCVYDISETFEENVLKELENIKPTLQTLGYDVTSLNEKLIFERDLKKAVQSAQVIQENGPENTGFKQELYKELESYISDDVLIFSSSSSIPASIISKLMTHPERVCIGHPFNPPHLVPLVEVIGGELTTQSTIDQAFEFYEKLGKKAVIINKEVPGFVTNRLQAALFRECIDLVLNGVVTPKDLDTVVTNSLGIRWAADGPFLSFHLGGGKGGFEHFMNHLGKEMPSLWKVLGQPVLDESNIQQLIDAVSKDYETKSIEQLEQDRDQKQLNIIKNIENKGVNNG